MPSSRPTTDHLSLPDNLTVRTASEIKDLLLLSLAERPSTTLDVPDQASIDLSFIQIIEGARLQSDQAGTALSLSKPADGALLAVLDRGGFLEAMSADDKQFWLHEGETQ